MFCSSCGCQLPDEANFCWQCGKPQKATAGSQVKEPKWETCEIVCQVKKVSSFFKPGEAKWYAIATGPKGQYQIGESPVFYAYINRRDGIETNDLNRTSAKDAFAVLTGTLVRDGWVLVSLVGVVIGKHIIIG